MTVGTSIIQPRDVVSKPILDRVAAWNFGVRYLMEVVPRVFTMESRGISFWSGYYFVLNLIWSFHPTFTDSTQSRMN
jgi:hypothetical protein